MVSLFYYQVCYKVDFRKSFPSALFIDSQIQFSRNYEETFLDTERMEEKYEFSKRIVEYLSNFHFRAKISQNVRPPSRPRFPHSSITLQLAAPPNKLYESPATSKTRIAEVRRARLFTQRSTCLGALSSLSSLPLPSPLLLILSSLLFS